jgi:hypothetical protein
MLVRWSFSLVALSLMFALPALAQALSAEEQVTTTDESAAADGEGEPFADIPGSLIPTVPAPDAGDDQ